MTTPLCMSLNCLNGVQCVVIVVSVLCWGPLDRRIDIIRDVSHYDFEVKDGAWCVT